MSSAQSLRRYAAAVALILALCLSQSRSLSGATSSTTGRTGVATETAPPIRKTTGDLTAAAALNPKPAQRFFKPEHEIPGREARPQDLRASFSAEYPARTSTKSLAASESAPAPHYPQVVSTVIDAITGPSETNAFPPDAMGAVGPAQFVVFVNGRIRTFNKVTGAADGVMNLTPSDFFANVMTPDKAAVINFVADPQVRYDRLSKRWILQAIDAPGQTSDTPGDYPNRVLLAVSDAASNGVITASTVWSFYYIQQNTVGGGDTGEFLDYDSLGVDANALYIGGNMFNAGSSAFVTTSLFVVQKSSLVSGGPLFVTAFRGLIDTSSGTSDGPDSPRGVDNFDPAATEGYVIGSSDAAYGRLILRRIFSPGSLTPTLSANAAIAVNATAAPLAVSHLGNTGGSSGLLDGLDDRLYAAHIRNGRLWTAHTIAVSPAGIASSSDPERRDGVRWYELNVPLGSAATLNQSGTLFDSATAVANARQYWIPSIMVSGQGHAAMGYSTAGAGFYINAGTNGRLSGDTAGTLAVPTLLTNSISAYNPSGDPSSPHRWGDYSYTSVDPDDDMTMWTIQEYCNATNTYGLRVAKLLAPPPATPATASPNAPTGAPSTLVTVTGISVSGSGFFDPGAGFAKHITASVTGGVTVNSVTFTDATHVTLNVNTTAAASGAYDVTITNPDGQSATGNGILAVGGATPSPSPNPTPTPSATPLPSPTPPGSGTAWGTITSPSPGSTLTGASVTFTWSAGSSSTAYWLTIGNAPDGTDIFTSGQTGGTYWTVTNLPTDGRQLDVTLRSLVNGTWHSEYYDGLPGHAGAYFAQALAVQTPVISPSSGAIKKTAKISIADGTPGATIYFTIDGTMPDGSSPVYSAPFKLAGKGTKTVRAIAKHSGVPDSSVATATLKISK